MKKLVALFLLMPMCASAEWTPAENAELEKVVLSKLDIGFAWQLTGGSIKDNMTTANKTLYTEALWRSVQASYRCGTAFAQFHNDQGDDDGKPVVTRSEFVSSALSNINSCVSEASAAVVAYDVAHGAIGDSRLQTASGLLASARDRMLSFDQGLPFMNYQPPGFPTSVGPHGDFAAAQRMLARSHLYFHHAMGDAVQFVKHADVWPVEANTSFNSMLFNARKASDTHARAWGLDGDVILLVDEEVIQEDTDAGSGLRPFAFFRLLREVELLFGFSQTRFSVPLHSERIGEQGFGTHLKAVDQQFAVTLSEATLVNSLDEIRQWWTSGFTSVSTDSPIGRALEFQRDLPDLWGDSDGAAQAWMGFYHEIPAPPGGGGGGFNCGAGTHPEGDDCVADPIVCGAQVPSVDIIINGTAVVCVDP